MTYNGLRACSQSLRDAFAPQTRTCGTGRVTQAIPAFGLRPPSLRCGAQNRSRRFCHMNPINGKERQHNLKQKPPAALRLGVFIKSWRQIRRKRIWASKTGVARGAWMHRVIAVGQRQPTQGVYGTQQNALTLSNQGVLIESWR